MSTQESEMKKPAIDGGSSLVPSRLEEKTQLQDLNERLTNYMQLMRTKREKQVSLIGLSFYKSCTYFNFVKQDTY